MSEAPRGLFGGSYIRFFDSGSRYSPERKKVMDAPCSLARSRKRGKRPLPTSPAPSQEKTTNCGGVCPGSSGSGLAGWCGWLPVKEVEPSPMGRAGRPSPLLPWVREPPGRPASSEDVEPPHPASDTAAAAPAPRPSAPRRERVREMVRMGIPDHHCLLGHPVRGQEDRGGSATSSAFHINVRNSALSHAKRTHSDHRRPPGRLPRVPKDFRRRRPSPGPSPCPSAAWHRPAGAPGRDRWRARCTPRTRSCRPGR